MAIVSVYIEEGCITCDACEETLPEVFHVTEIPVTSRPMSDLMAAMIGMKEKRV
ncbi:MAG: hypothetical protein Ct9H90mP14_2440 [Methanobacteriota archaeon]|nr:MAG: hypothetical protein Ct9H90mP14_2440 [Euryarchaeota archaeon]